MQKFFLSLCLFFLSFSLLHAEKGHLVNFRDVKMSEFLKYISKTTKTNFIVDEELNDFHVSLISGTHISKEELLKLAIELLENRGVYIKKHENFFFVKGYPKQAKQANIQEDFFVYKLRYHQGGEIQKALKDISLDFTDKNDSHLKKSHRLFAVGTRE